VAAAICATAVLATSLFAQGDRFYRLRGEVSGGPQDQSSLTVELGDVMKHSPTERSAITRNRTFEFHNIAGGTYQIRVVTQDGTILRQEQVNVNQFTGEITLTLPDVQGDHPNSGSVSLGQLKHKVPSKAKKAFAAAQKKTEAGDSEGAIAKLHEAIALDPEYFEAYNNLGCRLLNVDRAPEAIQAFQRAIEIDAHAPYAHANLAAALLFVHQPADAEAAARVAMETDGGISKTKYLLGMSLFHQHKFTREAAQNLRQSEEDFPNARLAAAAVLERLGEVKEAKVELNTYLNTGTPEKRTEVKAWLSRLK